MKNPRRQSWAVRTRDPVLHCSIVLGGSVNSSLQPKHLEERVYAVPDAVLCVDGLLTPLDTSPVSCPWLSPRSVYHGPPYQKGSAGRRLPDEQKAVVQKYRSCEEAEGVFSEGLEESCVTRTGRSGRSADYHKRYENHTAMGDLFESSARGLSCSWRCCLQDKKRPIRGHSLNVSGAEPSRHDGIDKSSVSDLSLQGQLLKLLRPKA